MNIKVNLNLQPHSMLVQIGGVIPVLFTKTFELALTPFVLKSLLVGLLPIHEHTFCDGQSGRVGKYDELTNTVEVYANMRSATKVYFDRLKDSGWKFNEEAAQKSYEGYMWSEEEDKKYTEERAEQEHSYKLLKKDEL